VAQKEPEQFHGEWIGQQPGTVKRRPQLRKDAPAAVALPEDSLRFAGDLIPAVPLPAREAILVDAAELRRRRLRNLGGNRPLPRYIPARVEQQARQSKMLGEQPALLNFRF